VCNREAPSVEEAAQKYRDSANFVGVAWTGDDDSFQGFIDKHGLTFQQISDDPGDVFDRFGVSYQPALVLVNTDGSTELLAGAVDPGLLDQVISEAN
jgi:peroxiredoxin